MVKYANHAKRLNLAGHLTPDTSTDSGGGPRNEYTAFTSGLDIGLSVAFQDQTQVLFDSPIDTCGDLDGQCFSR
jgi:hypothetical protein